MRFVILALLLAACLHFHNGTTVGGEEMLLRPARPLPRAASRPLTDGPTYVVDPANGNDSSDGSVKAPWKSLGLALRKLKPGDTLCLRGGIHRGSFVLEASGTPERPITIRACPGELAILDGGLREFFEDPAKAWEPFADGAPGEYRSTKTYSDFVTEAESLPARGFFAEAMVPFQGYRFLQDLRDSSMAWDLENKVGKEDAVYCGPGIHFDGKSGRFHARFAHTNIKALGSDNYRGETDARKIPLVLAHPNSGATLTLRGVHDVRIEDLVIRGSATSTAEVKGCRRIAFDGVTVYGGHSCFSVQETQGLRLLDTACRGQSAPWTFRGHLKYRSTESRLFSAGGWAPTSRESRDFEFARCEFTDSVDGVFVGNVRGVRLHHCLLDNVSDDGIFLTAATAYDGTTTGGDVQIFQNLISRCLTSFAFGVGHGRQKAVEGGRQTGAGVAIYRNVFDFRRPVMYQLPADIANTPELTSFGRFAGDHGSPLWEPMDIYQNTILADDAGGYTYATWGLGNAIGEGTRRRIFNNIVLQRQGLPGTHYPPTTSDTQIDGNLLWCENVSKRPATDLFAKFRTSPAFRESQKQYAPGWSAHDLFADPQFVQFHTDWRQPIDLRLKEGSPARDAGVAIPTDWPDPLRTLDARAPDLGALPADAPVWHVGVGGRLTVFGSERGAAATEPLEARPFESSQDPESASHPFPVAIVHGYPAFDLPLLEFAFRRHDVDLNVHSTWLPPTDYAKSRVVVVTGDLARAGMKPSQFAPDDLPHVRSFVENGGTLLITRGALDLFRQPEARRLLVEWTGPAGRAAEDTLQILQPKHPWARQLDRQMFFASLETPKDPVEAGRKKAAPADPLDDLVREEKSKSESTAVLTGMFDLRRTVPLWASRGERIIGTSDGRTTLYRVAVGKGQLIYVGWEIADAIPHGRKPSTVKEEKMFEDQMQVFTAIAADVCRP